MEIWKNDLLGLLYLPIPIRGQKSSNGPELFSPNALEKKFLFTTMTSGVKIEENRKGRILVGLRDIWRVCLEILLLHKSKEKRGK